MGDMNPAGKSRFILHANPYGATVWPALSAKRQKDYQTFEIIAISQWKVND